MKACVKLMWGCIYCQVLNHYSLRFDYRHHQSRVTVMSLRVIDGVQSLLYTKPITHLETNDMVTEGACILLYCIEGLPHLSLHRPFLASRGHWPKRGIRIFSCGRAVGFLMSPDGLRRHCCNR